MSNLFWLTMVRLAPFFPKSHGKPRVDDRRVLSGIIFINRNGMRWCDAPKEYGPAKTLYNRWKRWSDKGIFARMRPRLPGGGSKDGDDRRDLSEGAPIARQHMQGMCERGTATSLRAKKGGLTTSAAV